MNMRLESVMYCGAKHFPSQKMFNRFLISVQRETQHRDPLFFDLELKCKLSKLVIVANEVRVVVLKLWQSTLSLCQVFLFLNVRKGAHSSMVLCMFVCFGNRFHRFHTFPMIHSLFSVQSKTSGF